MNRHLPGAKSTSIVRGTRRIRSSARDVRGCRRRRGVCLHAARSVGGCLHDASTRVASVRPKFDQSGAPGLVALAPKVVETISTLDAVSPYLAGTYLTLLAEHAPKLVAAALVAASPALVNAAQLASSPAWSWSSRSGSKRRQLRPIPEFVAAAVGQAPTREAAGGGGGEGRRHCGASWVGECFKAERTSARCVQLRAAPTLGFRTDPAPLKVCSGSSTSPSHDQCRGWSHAK